MSDIMAAIGIEQLKRFPELAAKRQLLSSLYDSCLSNIPLIKPFSRNYSLTVPHIYPVTLHQSIDRDKLRSFLLDNGIQTGIHYYPNHLLQF